jgi:chemosensory pili system protein ChpC
MSEQESPTSLNALFSTIESGKLMIPDALIAEIVDFQTTHAENDEVPTWYLGRLPWRGVNIPLVSLEALNNDSFFHQSRSLKIIVIHGAFHRKTMPYWAFVALETPKMLRVMNDALTLEEEADLGKVEKMKVTMADESVMILDIKKLEEEIVGLLDKL